MLTLLDALKIGKQHFQKDEEHIVQVNETDDYYIIFGANKTAAVKYGRSDIKINKHTGELTLFRLPSIENFKLLEHSVKLDFENEEV